MAQQVYAQMSGAVSDQGEYGAVLDLISKGKFEQALETCVAK